MNMTEKQILNLVAVLMCAGFLIGAGTMTLLANLMGWF